MQTHYLVTGAAGFIGYHLAAALAADPDNAVVCVDNFARGEADEAYAELGRRPNVERIDGDLTDPGFVAGLPGGIDCVLHMAALNGTQNFYERPFEVVRCCTLPTMFLLERYGPDPALKRWVYAGTSEAYASTVTRFDWPVPTAEDVPLSLADVTNPRWSYAGSKMHGEIATTNACRAFAKPWTIIRYHNAYGPRMGDKHVVPDFLTRAREGVFALYGWEDTRSFLYIEDAVRATIAVAQAPACENEIVNIGGERELNMLELGRMMMQVGGFEGEIALHPSPAGSVKRRVPDVSKLKRLTGFTEQVSLEDGLKRAAAWYLTLNRG